MLSKNQSDNPNNELNNPYEPLAPGNAFLSTGEPPSLPWWDSVEDCIIFYFQKRDLIYSPASMKLIDDGHHSLRASLKDRVLEASRWVKKLRTVQVKKHGRLITVGSMAYKYLYYIHAGNMQPAAAVELLHDIGLLRGDWNIQSFREVYLSPALQSLRRDMEVRGLIP
jgi:hypothetical protein